MKVLQTLSSYVYRMPNPLLLIVSAGEPRVLQTAGGKRVYSTYIDILRKCRAVRSPFSWEFLPLVEIKTIGSFETHVLYTATFQMAATDRRKCLSRAGCEVVHVNTIG